MIHCSNNSMRSRLLLYVFIGLCMLAGSPSSSLHAADAVKVARSSEILDESNPGVHRTLYVRLESQPTAGLEVVITLASDTINGVTLSANTLTFTNSTWNVYQPVTVTPVDDGLIEDDNHLSTVTLTINAAATTYNPYDSVKIPDVLVTIKDNDAPTTVYRTGAALDEADLSATKTLWVRINTQPTAGEEVVINLASDTTLGVTLSANTLTFTSTKWNAYQAVTVTTVNDGVAEAISHTTPVTLTINTFGTSFNAYDTVTIPDQLFGIKDNDLPTTAYISGAQLDEGNLSATRTLALRVNAQPTAGQVVVIDLSSDTAQGVTLSQAALTFTNADWDQYQLVTVTTVDDAAVEATTHLSYVNLTVNQAATTYAAYDSVLIPSLLVAIKDNDAAVTVFASGSLLDESNPSATKTLSVRINTQPTAGQVVVIDLGSDTAQGVSLSATTLTFTNGNWDQYQPVTITTVDDAVVESIRHLSNITLTINQVATTFDAYDGMTIPDQAVSIQDNDSPTTVFAAGAVLDEANLAATKTLSVRINTQPTAGQVVVIDLSSDTAQGVSLSANTLTFTNSNWEQYQLVTITTVDDAVFEDPVHLTPITLTIDPVATTFDSYDSVTIPDQTLGVHDNDLSLNLSESELSFSTTQAGGNPAAQTFAITHTGNGTASWSIGSNQAWLSATPTSGATTTENDTITVSVDVSGLTPATYNGTITITDPVASNTPQTITVTFTVNPPVPTFNLTPATLAFNGVQGGADPVAQTSDLTNTTGSLNTALNWTANSDQPWISLSPTTGTTTTETDILTIGAVLQRTEQWSTTTITTNAPSARGAHSAVWTGSEMIVWGGNSNSGYLTNGGRYNPANNTWSTMSSANAPPARIGHTAVWTGTEMIVWGGYNIASGGFLDVGGRYNPATNTWASLSTLNVPVGRASHTAVWTGSEMIIWGGEVSAGIANTVVNTGRRYNPTTDTWSPTSLSTTDAPSARDRHSSVWTGSEMIVWGGWDNDIVNTGGRYNPTTDFWTPTSLPQNGPIARMWASAAWTGAEMIIWGGYDGTNIVDTGERYNPVTNTWTGVTTTTNASSARYLQSAVWTGSEMILWGGWDVAYTNTGKRYQPAMNLVGGTYNGDITLFDPSASNTPQTINVTFAVSPSLDITTIALPCGEQNVPYAPLTLTAIAGTPPYTWSATGLPSGLNLGSTGALSGTPTVYGDFPVTVMVADSLAASASKIFTISLVPAKPTITLTPNSLTFTAGVGDSNPPTQTVNLTNTGTPGSILNWTVTSNYPWLTVSSTSGTTNSETDVLTVGTTLQPADQWTTTTEITDAPSARSLHSMVWTGSELIIWGGAGFGSVRLNTGGRYNPTTNLWSSAGTQYIGTPTARYGHTAIWTGSEMIVWGGTDGTDVFSDGGRYNPTTNTWSPTAISTIYAPTARKFHSAIWTGSEMIVWGGTGGGPVFNTGGRYNPTSNTWSAIPMSTSGAPSARERHTAIWTGSEMIVWGGGTNSAVAINTGGRFNPTTDSWSLPSVTTIGAPIARQLHSAIWTGSEMIVWDGMSNDSGPVHTGGRYNPAANVWVGGITTTGAHEVRHGHQAVWSGTEMIVWGGYDASDVVNTGMKYRPTEELSAGTYNPTVTVSTAYATNNPQTIDVTLTVLGITTLSLPVGEQNAPYTLTTLAAGNGTPSYTWSATGLPTGLVLGSVTGELSGTPTVNGDFPVTITVIDDLGRIANKNFTITVTPPVPTITLSPGNLTFDTDAGTSDPASQTINLTNTGTTGSILNWTATSDQPWLTVSPSTDTTTTETDALTIDVLLYHFQWGAPLESLNAPSVRDSHSAVWTGSEMIVWGGYHSGVPLATGDRFAPATNTWTTIATTNAPEARYAHSTVWTGSKMIVWGGYGTGAALNTGGIYDSGTNSWTTISVTNAPTGRGLHSAIWTGSEMIIWGGKVGPNSVNSGARYNPTTDLWSVTPTSTTNGPVARRAHSAVWTGTEMIVWGGYGTSVALNDGGRFNPTSDIWSTTPMSTINAPAARQLHSAVWTGSEMIIWGGYDLPTGQVTAGRRYNPSTNLWSAPALTTINAPSARSRHTAVWADGTMIVWGGWDGTEDCNDGERYEPAPDFVAGTYNATITFSDPSASNNSQSIGVTFTVH